jgi:hypothetical protein
VLSMCAALAAAACRPSALEWVLPLPCALHLLVWHPRPGKQDLLVQQALKATL